MKDASDAFQRYMATDDEGARHHLFLAMVLAYCRPFTNNYGIGSLLCEYPLFPDFTDADMNLRHKRMIDVRNKLLGHSSIEGTRVHLLAPGATSLEHGVISQGYCYEMEKLVFSGEPQFVSDLHDIVGVLSRRLAADISVVSKEVGSKFLQNGEIYQLDTGKKTFEWTK